MIMQEHDDNIFTKEKTDVEKYLLRIIQRYFETENNYAQASIESIIVESITRFKRFCKDKGKGYIFSFNQQTGHITLNIGSFQGEPAFSKNTAFNKDFGMDSDTICAGDDLRLSDARPPYTHYHTVADIQDLDSILATFDIPKYIHSHKNQNIIDMLRYTGTSLSVDLIIIEQMKKQMLVYETKINGIEADMLKHKNVKLDSLNSSIVALKSFLDSISSNIIAGMQWANEIEKDIDKANDEIYANIKKQVDDFFTQEALDKLKDKSKKTYVLSASGTASLDVQCSDVINQGDYTFFKTIEKNISLPNSDMVKTYFMYEDATGKEIKIPLPFIFNDEHGSPVVIQASQTGSSIAVSTTFTNKIQGHAAKSNSYKNGKVAIVATRNNLLEFYPSYLYIQENNWDWIKYDPNNTALKSLISSATQANHMYHICASVDEGVYYNADETVAAFNASHISGGDGPCIAINTTSGLTLEYVLIDWLDQIFEVPMPKLSNYYTNPKIYYETFKEGV